MYKNYFVSILVGALLLLVAFFLPWLQLDGMMSLFSSETLRISAFTMLTSDMEVSFFYYLLLFIPIVSLGSILCFVTKKHRLLQIVGPINSVLPLLFTLVAAVLYRSESGDMEMLSFLYKPDIGYYVTAFISLLMCIATFMVYKKDKAFFSKILDDVNSSEEISRQVENVGKQKELFQKELKTASKLQISFLIIAVLLVLGVLGEASESNWEYAFKGFILVALNIYMFYKMKIEISDSFFSNVKAIAIAFRNAVPKSILPKDIEEKVDVFLYGSIILMIVDQLIRTNDVVTRFIHDICSGLVYFVIILLMVTFIKEKYLLFRRGITAFALVYALDFLSYTIRYGAISVHKTLLVMFWSVVLWFSWYVINQLLEDEMVTEEVHEI
ncbi:MAG: hypothetical protein JXO44_02095 [Clostridia bacterium]|nr:hypothetical protein [Clostridia bacterium]